jgi:hypothetical protein
MESIPVKTLYELPFYIQTGQLPDYDTLRAAFEYEYEATIGQWEKLSSTEKGTVSVDAIHRKPNLDLLVIIAGILQSKELFERILSYKVEQDNVEVKVLHTSGISRGINNGLPFSKREHLTELCDAGIKLLNNLDYISQTAESIRTTILMYCFKVLNQERGSIRDNIKNQ